MKYSKCNLQVTQLASLSGKVTTWPEPTGRDTGEMMAHAARPPREAEAGTTFGSVAREVVRAEAGGRVDWRGLELATHFQPLYCVESGNVAGDEALVRATDADGRTLRGAELFAAAGIEGKVRLDWICRALHMRNYAVVDPGDRRLFLNVDPLAVVEDEDGGRAFEQLARYYGLAPERISLEILEADTGDEKRLAEAVGAYRKRGFAIVMDHFGEGRSNFDRITLLRPKLVKVDRALLIAAVGETRARRMLPAFIDLLKDTGAEVAVKGVENALEALDAIEAGAAYLQGFHLGAPRRPLHEEALARELMHSARRLAMI